MLKTDAEGPNLMHLTVKIDSQERQPNAAHD